jgi:peptide-methionine (S)-S-oxide reductase
MSRCFCLPLLAASFTLSAAEFPAPAVDIPSPAAKQTASIVLAGGCFWGVEAVFDRINGVTKVVSGFAGGKKTTAHYEMVSTGMTGHAESVQVDYDPSQISYGKLLEVFFSVAHDPTELNRQGPDYGTQYRSAIFYSNDEQKRVAEAYIKQLNQAKIYSRPIVTQITPLEGFYRAEEYHQHYLDHNPNQPYIVYNDMPKLKHLRQQFPDLLKQR